ncbi:MAG: D-2-hydroxyacid dehydrogenase [Rickettsiales bacterium]
MTDFPEKKDLNIHFAHSAYRLAERFEARETGISCFQTWDREETDARMGEAAVAVMSGFWRNDYLDEPGALRFVQVCAAGYDQFDQAKLAMQHVRLANGSGVNKNAVSDHALALMLGLTRQIHVARDNQRRNHWRPMISDLAAREDELAGKTVMIIGMGAIGARVARLAKAFEMKVIGVRRNTAAISSQVDEAYTPAELPGLWPRVDFVVLTCPLTPETANIVDGAALAAMAPTAYLINVARGGCVDETVLIEGLRAGTIAGAGIDTTMEEPLAETSPLWAFDNVILTPHTAGETRQYEENVIDILLENLDRLWRGEAALYNQIV